ncbi:MAG: ankyrin repeat domain-containing protein [bacterium]
MKCCARPGNNNERGGLKATGSRKKYSMSKSDQTAQFVQNLYDAFKPSSDSSSPSDISIKRRIKGGIDVEKFHTNVEMIFAQIQSGQIAPEETQRLLQDCRDLRDRYASDPNNSRHKAMCQQLIKIELKLRMTLEPMPPVDLSNADLSGMDLTGFDLTNVDLRGANLDNARLREADSAESQQGSTASSAFGAGSERSAVLKSQEQVLWEKYFTKHTGIFASARFQDYGPLLEALQHEDVEGIVAAMEGLSEVKRDKFFHHAHLGTQWPVSILKEMCMRESDETFLKMCYQLLSLYRCNNEWFSGLGDEVAKKLVKVDGTALTLLSDDLGKNNDFLLDAVKANWEAIKSFPKEAKEDKEFYLLAKMAVLESFGADYIGYLLKPGSDPENDVLIRYASENCEMSLYGKSCEYPERYLDRATEDGLQSDLSFVESAIEKGRIFIEHIPTLMLESLQATKKYQEMEVYPSEEYRCLQVLSSLKDNTHFQEELLGVPSLLKYASDELKGDKEVVLAVVAQNGDVSLVKSLIAAGKDINYQNLHGEIPLHFAVYNGHVEIVKLLLGNGADINAKDKNGRTPLEVAVARGHQKIIEILKASDATNLLPPTPGTDSSGR